MDWGKKWLVDFVAGKTELVSFDQSIGNGFIEEKQCFKLQGLTLAFLNWFEALTLSLLLRLPARKLEL